MPGRPPDISTYQQRTRDGLEILGRALYEARRVAGVTQRQLGEMVGVDQSTISRLERGRLTGLRLTKLALIISGLDALTFDLPPYARADRSRLKFQQ
ncbi:MAG TPA: helix-turn-helix transcriptional regulator [Candidatus Limnocylindrales bacterium]|nr:helix-turn-helix transcriptional regulator [Candidatus Limnocylindrales bacterium]